MVHEKRFREDLWYRLRVIELNMPPLRDREDDIIHLAGYFLDRLRRQVGRGPRKFSKAAIAALRSYPWPGNVRELKNAVERALVLGVGDEIAADELGLAPRLASAPREVELISLAEAEQQHIQRVLKAVEGNKTEACKVLEIGRATLYNKLQKYGEA